MSKKTVIKTDLIGRACKSEILAIVATIQGIPSCLSSNAVALICSALERKKRRRKLFIHSQPVICMRLQSKLPFCWPYMLSPPSSGIKSMDIDAEKCTLTVVGTVDPVRIVRKLRKKCFSACIVTVEDDKPKEEKKDPCKEAKEKLEKAWKEYCEKCNVKLKPGCLCSCSSYPTPCQPCFPPSSSCSFPPIGCHNRGICPPPPPPGYGYGCYYEERYPGGECVIQ